MRTISRVSLLLFVLARSAAGSPIEFSEVVRDYMGEGILYHRLVFNEDKRQIFYQLPKGWRCAVTGKSLQLTPPNTSFAGAQIESIPLPAPQPITQAMAPALTQQVVDALPPASQHVSVVKQEQNPILLNNNPSFEVLVSYSILGDTFERGVLFVNTPTNQIVFKFTARKSEFDALYRAFRSSILTWEWQ